MITAKQAYEIAKEWMGPFALVSAGYETESHFIFLREHNRGKLWTDHASFWIDIFGSITGESSGQIMLPSGLTRRTAH